MTKERKLAIQLWQKIRDKIANNSNLSDIAIFWYKEIFCRKHNLDWSCCCWFCQYMPTCRQCPIFESNGCGCSVYMRVCNPLLDEKERLEACDKIIAALKGECNL